MGNPLGVWTNKEVNDTNPCETFWKFFIRIIRRTIVATRKIHKIKQAVVRGTTNSAT